MIQEHFLLQIFVSNLRISAASELIVEELVLEDSIVVDLSFGAGL